MSIDRRDVFRILGAAAGAAHLHAAERAPKFFNREEYAVLDEACEVILPADEQGGGAHEAGVPAYIDIVLSHADAPTKEIWKRSLATLASGDLPAALTKLAENEASPQTELDRFFVRLKALTIEAYFQSTTGYKYVRYKGTGHTFIFPGCTHPEHKVS